jgi:hypothetical protein
MRPARGQHGSDRGAKARQQNAARLRPGTELAVDRVRLSRQRQDTNGALLRVGAE